MAKKLSSGAQRKDASRRRGAPAAFDPIAEAKLALLAKLVQQLARAIGPNCEVVLHDNRWAQPTIRAIGNSHVTDRQIGDLMTRTVLDGVEIKDHAEPVFNYAARTPDNKRLRVSLLPIVHENLVIAYLSVNYLVEDLELARQTLTVLTNAEPHSQVFEQYLSTGDVIDAIIEKTVCSLGRPAQRLSRSERIELLRRLKQNGALNMRGAVERIARALNLSRAAIYNYLREIN